MPRYMTAIMATVLLAGTASGERIKDIVDVEGVRSNPLWGYGLVIGLNGTGDNSEASRRAMANLLKRSGLTFNPADVASKNIASVLVTAELGPFSRKGSTLDVTVSTIGNATSLQGGTLVMTPLVGADGNTYVVAQGAISIGGGFSASGESASATKNHPTVGRIPSGGAVEKEELATFAEKGVIVLHLKNADFGTAENITKAINGVYADSAAAEDAGTIKVLVPKKLSKAEVPKFIDAIGALDVKVDYPAMVVINERTGTIIVGENVKISTVAISHGNLSIVTQDKTLVSQPGPFTKGGRTEKTVETEIQATEDTGSLRVVERQVSVAELAKALNAMGLTPRDMIAIFEALRQAGALQAQLKIM